MDYDYLGSISGLISLNTFRKAVSLLEGDYLSPYRNRSREFDDLTQYTYGDNIRDIDWKSSARTGDLLVRRYVAQKRHMALFVCDTGYKMTGHTSAGELKNKLSETTLGVAARIFSEIGMDYALICGQNKQVYKTFFRSSSSGVLSLVDDYKHCMDSSQVPFTQLLDTVVSDFRKEMITFLITDIDGLTKLDEKRIRRIMYNKDLMVVCIDDAMLTNPNSYDILHHSYVDSYMIGNKYLMKKEREIKDRIYHNAEDILRKSGGGIVKISSEQEIIDGIIDLVQQISYR